MREGLWRRLCLGWRCSAEGWSCGVIGLCESILELWNSGGSALMISVCNVARKDFRTCHQRSMVSENSNPFVAP